MNFFLIAKLVHAKSHSSPRQVIHLYKQNKKLVFFNYPGNHHGTVIVSLSECPTIDHLAPLTPLQDSWSVSWISGRVNKKEQKPKRTRTPLVVVMASDVYL